VPIVPVGKLVLNRNPDNFFAETEQVAFCTAHVVPGIDFSNDPLLAGRIHSYVDTQITRLGGPNFHEIPINAPIAQAHNNQRDGLHRQAINRGRVSYEPNSLGGGCPFQAGAKGFVSFPEPMETGAHKVRGKAERFADHYTQATIRARMVSGLMNVAPELADAVASGLGITEMPEPMPKVLQKKVRPEVTKSPSLSLFARPGDGSIRTRHVAILVADGVKAAPLTALASRLAADGAVPRFIGPALGSVSAADGDDIQVDMPISAAPSVVFDAVVLPDGADAVAALAADGRMLEFLKDQYRHCKPILVLGAGSGLIAKAGIPRKLPSGKPDSGLVVAASDEGKKTFDAFRGAIAAHRHFARETDPPRV
jgi:catalase